MAPFCPRCDAGAAALPDEPPRAAPRSTVRFPSGEELAPSLPPPINLHFSSWL